MNAENEDAPWRDEETLRRLYVDERLTLDQVGDRLGCSRITLQRWMDRYEIDRRDGYLEGIGRDVGGPWRDEETLRRLYVDEGLSTPEIGERLGCAASTVSRNLHANGISPRTGPLGPAHFRTNRRGYERMKGAVGGEVYVHQLLVIAAGEDPHEVFADGMSVHHKTPIPWLNTPDNVELLTQDDHRDRHLGIEREERPWRDEDRLREAYKDATLDEIADDWGCGQTTVRRWMSRFGIERRPSPVGNGGGENPP